jgi:hypothetical protein
VTRLRGLPAQRARDAATQSALTRCQACPARPRRRASATPTQSPPTGSHACPVCPRSARGMRPPNHRRPGDTPARPGRAGRERCARAISADPVTRLPGHRPHRYYAPPWFERARIFRLARISARSATSAITVGRARAAARTDHCAPPNHGTRPISSPSTAPPKSRHRAITAPRNHGTAQSRHRAITARRNHGTAQSRHPRNHGTAQSRHRSITAPPGQLPRPGRRAPIRIKRRQLSSRAIATSRGSLRSTSGTRARMLDIRSGRSVLGTLGPYAGLHDRRAVDFVCPRGAVHRHH